MCIRDRVSGSLFSATKKFRYQNEDGSYSIIDANPKDLHGIGATSMTVSYTHLDVYKRQMPQWTIPTCR